MEKVVDQNGVTLDTMTVRVQGRLNREDGTLFLQVPKTGQRFRVEENEVVEEILKEQDAEGEVEMTGRLRYGEEDPLTLIPGQPLTGQGG